MIELKAYLLINELTVNCSNPYFFMYAVISLIFNNQNNKSNEHLMYNSQDILKTLISNQQKFQSQLRDERT